MTVRRNKPDDLTKKYLEMEERILLDLERRKYKNIPELKKDLRDKIADAMKTLETVNSEFVEKELGAIYRERVEKGLSGDFRRLRDNIFIDLKTGLQGAVKGLNERVSNILKAQSEQEIATVFSATNAIREELTKSGVFKVTYSDGKQIPLASYAFMAARSARTETANTANLDAAKRNGSDLVKCTTIYPTCEICSQFQGRVYSISGKDKRFPALYETALKNGYQLMHPNCRHEFLPYFEELRTEEEIEKDRAFSNRPFNRDYRGKKERDAYTDWQVFNRQVREERAEYNELKSILGNKMPYKTIGGFRRARRAKSPEWEKLHYRKRDQKDFFEYRNTVGEKVPKTLEEFQELRYNDTEIFSFIKLDYMRRKDLIKHPEKALPSSKNFVLDDKKFTNYLFGGNLENGLAKGRAIKSRLGYDLSNWQDFKKEIAQASSKYPVLIKGEDQFGVTYEQKIILYGLKGKPANLVVGWKYDEERKHLHLTSVYIKEVKNES